MIPPLYIDWVLDTLEAKVGRDGDAFTWKHDDGVVSHISGVQLREGFTTCGAVALSVVPGLTNAGLDSQLSCIVNELCRRVGLQ